MHKNRDPEEAGGDCFCSLPGERRLKISQFLEEEGKVGAIDLSKRLGVSEDTIRRDLKEMDRAGLLCRVHGGALPRSAETIPYHVRVARKSPKRGAIARMAAGLVEEGQVVLIDGGTTCTEIARSLPLDIKMTVVTHSPPILMALAEHKNIDVIMLGGLLNPLTMTVEGGTVITALNMIRADVCFLGVCSLHGKLGVTTSVYGEAEIKRIMVEHSAETIAVSTAEKIGRVGQYVICPIESISKIVTDRATSDEVLAAYSDGGVTVLKA